MSHGMSHEISHAADAAIFDYVDALLADSLDPSADQPPELPAASLTERADTPAATAAGACAEAEAPVRVEPIDLVCIEAPGMDIAIERRCIVRMLPALPTPERIPGAPAWCMGRASTSEGPRIVIDPLRLLAPDGTHSVACWLLATDGFVLALPELPRVLMLDRDAVVWKTDRSTRPWLAGVAGRERCVVLDAPGLQQLVAELAPVGSAAHAA